MSFLANLGKCEKRSEQAASGGFLLDTFLWRKIAPAFSAFATSMWLSAQRKVARLPVRELAFKKIVAVATQKKEYQSLLKRLNQVRNQIR